MAIFESSSVQLFKSFAIVFFSSHFCSMLALETAMQVSNLESAQIAQFQKQKKNQKEKRIVRKKNSQNCKEKRNYSIILIFCLKFLSPVYRAPRISLSLSSTDWSWSLSFSSSLRVHHLILFVWFIEIFNRIFPDPNVPNSRQESLYEYMCVVIVNDWFHQLILILIQKKKSDWIRRIQFVKD